MNDLELAKQRLLAGSLSFVLVKDGVTLCSGTREGIAELLEASSKQGDAAHGASLADKIVGKAVAMIARAAGIRAVYTPLASQAARDALAADHIPLEYERLVPLVLNKRNDGPCPMERLTLPIDDPLQAIAALEKFVRSRPATPPGRTQPAQAPDRQAP